MSRKNWAILVLFIVHLAGVIGMLSPYKEQFLLLTPLNLLISLAILIRFHEGKGPRFYFTMTFIMIAGFVVEIIGVNTGWPFGVYEYGEPLGPKLLGTPFMIGVNWFILSYCGAMLFRRVTKSPFVNAVITGIAIMAFDILLEPVAIHLNFWTWSAESVPIQNYITWTVCVSLFAYVVYRIESQLNNPIAKWVLAVQVVFFAGLLIGTQV